MATLIVTLGRKQHEIDLHSGESLLDAALRAGLDVPYSCMEGVCTACMAQVREGKINFPEDTTLTERDSSEGKTLTCQAKLGMGCQKVVIDYDAV